MKSLEILLVFTVFYGRFNFVNLKFALLFLRVSPSIIFRLKARGTKRSASRASQLMGDQEKFPVLCLTETKAGWALFRLNVQMRAEEV